MSALYAVVTVGSGRVSVLDVSTNALLRVAAAVVEVTEFVVNATFALYSYQRYSKSV
jgi:hypothetical protein